MTTVADTAQGVRPRLSSQLWRRVFSFPAALCALFALLAVLTVRSRFDDPDMWWHLALGKLTWTTHALPTRDVFSYTTGHYPYVPHEWLSQLTIYGAYRFGGYTGLMSWLCVFAAMIPIAGYLLCWIYSKNAKVAFLGGLIVWFFSTIGVAIRPQMIGYLFLILELVILHLGQTRNARWFFALPPLFAIWVNSHGSFFLGLVLAGTALLTSLFEFRAGLLVCKRWKIAERRALTAAIALCCAALFLNPVGTNQILYPVRTMFHPSIGVNEVQEWQALQFDDVRAFALVGVLVFIFLIAMIRRSELDLSELLLLSLGAWLAMSHRRMLFVFGILAAPVISRLLATSWEDYDAKDDRPAANVFLIIGSLLIIFFAFPGKRMLEQQVEKASPVKAVDFVRTNHLSGNMLNDWTYGGYLLWAMPEHPVFIDGRGDVFEESGVLADFANWATLQRNPNELLTKYRIDFCLLARRSPMATVLSALDWQTIYSDHNSVVIVRKQRDN